MSGMVRRVVILGDGVAGWMSAARLGRAFAGSDLVIELVPLGRADDESLGPFGPAESAMPALHAFLDTVGIDETILLRAGRGSFALGTAFHGWSGAKDAWFFPYGAVGVPMGTIAFPALVTRLRQAGQLVRSTDFSLAAVAAAAGRFSPPTDDPASVLSSFSYGLNFTLSALAEACAAVVPGVRLHAAPFVAAHRSGTGAVRALELANGALVQGDLFLDCSGDLALLCGDSAFQDWSHWLRSDRVLIRTMADEGMPPPHANMTAHGSGWLRTVPLRGGPSETLFFASGYSNASAFAGFSDAPVKSFVQGRRSAVWSKNVIAIGAAAAVLEPLYGQNLELVCGALDRLITLFPAQADGPEREEYNRLSVEATERVRDFLIAHYKTNQRGGERFWDDVRRMSVPDALNWKLDLYASRGRVPLLDAELFTREEWTAMLDGQGVHPRRCDVQAEAIPQPAIIAHLTRLREIIVGAARAMPSHHEALVHLGAAT